MEWQDCAGHTRKVTPNTDKINSIVKAAEVRRRIVQSGVFDDDTASAIAVDYYEVVKLLLTALLEREGYKSDNHTCLVDYFKHKYPDKSYETAIMDQLRIIRNRASYEGVLISKEYIERNKLEIEYIIDLLRELL
ncbi:MAG: hypothetical protein ABIG95_06510 [Candidatus Woesearchaeota archaeon]